MGIKNKYIFVMLVMVNNFMTSKDTTKTDSDNAQAAQKKKSHDSMAHELLEFNYNQIELKDILNDFAQQRGINLIYPETDTITSKVTFDAGEKITMNEAWEFVVMILDQAGFTLVRSNASTYLVMANKKSLKEPVPLYINVDYNVLPDSNEKLRYMYFCNSIQLARQQSEIKTILTNVLGAIDLEDKLIFDLTSNALIFTARPEMIKVAMRLISTFDETGFKEAVEILKLDYAQASEVAQILTTMMTSIDAKKNTGYVSLSTGARTRYFSEYANVIDLDPKGFRKLNSLVLMGKTEDVNHIKDFIKKYLDVPQQQGKSFYHVVELEWLNATNFVSVLNNLVQGQSSTSTGQSSGSITSDLAFDPQVKIIQETVSQGLSSSNSNSYNNSYGGSGYGGSASGNNTGQRGGNRIIITSPERDWHRLEQLIKLVDIPQKQVVIEALVLDLDLQFVRRLTSQMRTRGLCPTIFPKDMQAQAGLTLNNIIQETQDSEGNVTDRSLLGDLSNILAGNEGGVGGGFGSGPSSVTDQSDGGTYISPGESATSSSSTTTAGYNNSTVFMLSDDRVKNGVWAFFQLLSTHKASKVLTRPMIIASNNKSATLTSSAVKNLAGGVSSSNSPTIGFSQQDAPISVNFTPIISANDMVNLQMDINLSLWLNPADENSGSQIARQLKTNISMRSGDVVILGGLLKDHVSKSKKSIPFIERIPLLGSLAANRLKDSTKDQLYILIRPTVIAPRVEGGMGSITAGAMNYMTKEFVDYENAFSNLKDPITRWFFHENMDKGSARIDHKMADLADKNGLPVSAPEESMDTQTDNKQYNTRPLGVNWFGEGKKDKSDPKQEKNMEQLNQQLQSAVNPFSQRLVL